MKKNELKFHSKKRQKVLWRMFSHRATMQLSEAHSIDPFRFKSTCQ